MLFMYNEGNYTVSNNKKKKILMIIQDVQGVLSVNANTNKDHITKKARAENFEYAVLRMTR